MPQPTPLCRSQNAFRRTPVVSQFYMKINRVNPQRSRLVSQRLRPPSSRQQMPPDYIKNAATLFSNGGDTVVAVLAFPAIRENNGQTFGMRNKNKIAVQLMPRQTHSGGYGQSFRTSALKAVGGFTAEIWPYCLMDHEIIHRLTKYQNNKARVLYDSNHWCAPSTRRVDRSKVRWTLSERLLYHVTPFQYRDWFFYSFLKSKFDARGVSELNLRRKEWINPTDQVPT